MVGYVAYQTQIMGDEEHRHAPPPLQRGDQVEDLLLHRHVERAGRLVGNQQLRLAGDRHRDHHALLLAAREPGRDGSQLGLRRGQADLFEKTQGLGARLPARKPAMLAQHLRDLEADAEHRIKRAHRLLEDHRDLGAAQRAQLARRTLQQVLALENNPAACARIPRQQPQNGKRGHGLAAAGFAHQCHRAVLRDIEAHAFHRRDGAEVHAQVAYAEEAHCSLGSSASRTASVNKLNAVTASAIAAVAAAICHHMPRISSLGASASMLPHETVSTPTPKPRKLRITSDLINSTTWSESCTSTTWLTFGRMCANMRRVSEAPMASAASTYSRTRCLRYSARTKRKIPVQPVSPRIKITVRMPFWPRTAATASTSSR